MPSHPFWITKQSPLCLSHPTPNLTEEWSNYPRFVLRLTLVHVALQLLNCNILLTDWTEAYLQSMLASQPKRNAKYRSIFHSHSCKKHAVYTSVYMLALFLQNRFWKNVIICVRRFFTLSPTKAITCLSFCLSVMPLFTLKSCNWSKQPIQD